MKSIDFMSSVNRVERINLKKLSNITPMEIRQRSGKSKNRPRIMPPLNKIVPDAAALNLDCEFK